ncbi:hypothetical protein HY213_04500 [Candidatus Peregrinibacteria bacterium]|nr:hypothetical protein [Candidatus Peregrinibacteria bacterium]
MEHSKELAMRRLQQSERLLNFGSNIDQPLPFVSCEHSARSQTVLDRIFLVKMALLVLDIRARI